jgi:hypothetical protein
MSHDDKRTGYAARAQAGKELATHLLSLVVICFSIFLAAMIVLPAADTLGIDTEKPAATWIELFVVLLIFIGSMLLFACIGSFPYLLLLSLFLNRAEIEDITIRSRPWRISRFERWLFDKLFRAQ